ncbi:hypothetical protein IAT38_006925 [Cryptococcus sp. DSM 104549]
MKLEGKAIIVTGGLGSIGGHTAKAIVAKGGLAVVFDVVPQAEGDKRIKTFENADSYFYEQTDIGDRAKIQSAVDSALTKIPKGSLAGAVHCAATNSMKPWSTKMSDKIDDFDKVMRINAWGTFAVDAIVADAINAQFPPLDPFHERVTEERGCIVNISSIVAYDTPARCLTYGPSKTAVLGITKAAADFLAPTGIRVNSIAPALVSSPLLNNGGRAPYFKEEVEACSMFPRRFTLPNEIADAIVFLLETEMINAFDLKVDAGWKNCSIWAAGLDPRKRAVNIE